jgi:hypothetical protein
MVGAAPGQLLNSKLRREATPIQTSGMGSNQMSRAAELSARVQGNVPLHLFENQRRPRKPLVTTPQRSTGRRDGVSPRLPSPKPSPLSDSTELVEYDE